MTQLQPWSTYAALGCGDKINLNPDADIVDLAAFHAARHSDSPAIIPMLAYAQASRIYRDGAIVEVAADVYARTPPDQRVNVFDRLGAAYRPELTVIYMARLLAEITSDAAEYIANHAKVMVDGRLQGDCRLLVIDSLRTVDAAYLLASANPDALQSRLLSLPGTSAHNKGMAVDCIIMWQDGEEIVREADMRGHVDCPDMTGNHRNFSDITADQKHNRLVMERAFLRAALANHTLIAPLREEFWDFRFPEYPLDLWRVLESVARAIEDADSLHYLGDVLTAIRDLARAGRREAIADIHPMDEARFADQWQALFSGNSQQAALQEHLGTTTPPAPDKAKLIWHGDYNVLYDADLPPHMRQANPGVLG